MKRYVKCTMQIYGSANVDIDIESLKNSVFYLFRKVAEEKGLKRTSRLRVTSMKLLPQPKDKYNLYVSYDFLGYRNDIELTNIPLNQEIPEDYWVTTSISAYLSLSRDINPPSEAREKIEEAFNQFKEVVLNANSDFITYGNFKIDDKIKDFNYSKNDFIKFMCSPIAINVPGFDITIVNDRSCNIRYHDMSINTYTDMLYVEYSISSDKFNCRYSTRFRSIDVLPDDIESAIRRDEDRINNKCDKLKESYKIKTMQDEIIDRVHSENDGVILEFNRLDEYGSWYNREYKLTVDGKVYTYRNQYWVDCELKNKSVDDVVNEINAIITKFRKKVAAEQRKEEKLRKAREEEERREKKPWELNPVIYEDTAFLENGDDTAFLESGE